MKKTKKMLFFILVSCAVLATACTKRGKVTGSKYIQEKDDQPFFDKFHNIAGTKDGYYLLEDQRISYYDKNSSKSHVLCDKPQCTHEDEACNAYTEAGSIRIYDGNIYCVEEDKNNPGDCNFYKISKDGSKKDELFVMFHREGDEIEQLNINSFIVHRGYVYYCLADFSKEPPAYQIIRRELKKNGEAEILQEFSFDDTFEFSEFQGVGDYVYYDVVKKDASGKYGELYAYDTKEHTTACILDKTSMLKFFVAEGKNVYYTDDKNLYVKQMTNSQSEKVMPLPEQGYYKIGVDSDYFYFDNYCDISVRFLNSGKSFQEYTNPKLFQDRKVYVCRKGSKEQVAVLDIGTSDTVYVGDENMVLLGDEMTERSGSMSILSKNTLGTENQEWKEIQ